jgi:hypothetical protein
MLLPVLDGNRRSSKMLAHDPDKRPCRPFRTLGMGLGADKEGVDVDGDEEDDDVECWEACASAFGGRESTDVKWSSIR